MKKSNARLLFSVVGGLLLIAAGVVFLLENLELITLDWEIYFEYRRLVGVDSRVCSVWDWDHYPDGAAGTHGKLDWCGLSRFPFNRFPPGVPFPS